MGFKFKPGDMIVPIDDKPTSNRVYIISSTSTSPSTSHSDAYPIYRVTVPNSISRHNCILDKSSRYIHKAYRLATVTEKVLFGK